MKNYFFQGTLALLFLTLTLFLLFFVFHKSTDDEEKLKEIEQTTQGRSYTLSAIKQERKGIYKEIWQYEGMLPKMIRIESPSSKVIAKEDEGVYHLVEELEECDCWMQEKIDKQTQELRHLSAHLASFSYDTHAFLASEVSIARYLGKGSKIPIKETGLRLLMRGSAASASFTMEESGISFHADHLKATFF